MADCMISLRGRSAVTTCSVTGTDEGIVPAVVLVWVRLLAAVCVLM